VNKIVSDMNVPCNWHHTYRSDRTERDESEKDGPGEDHVDESRGSTVECVCEGWMCSSNVGAAVFEES
jgi:hypothetical protein